jgi:two-component system chemotaxis sensor kinase CheA
LNRDDLAARLLATFVAELADQVRVMNEALLALEPDPRDEEHLLSVFRVAHTLKGAARAASVPLVERVCHELEELLAQARKGTRVLGPAEFERLFAAADALADAADRLGADRELTGSPLATLDSRPRGAAEPVDQERPARVPPQEAPAPSHESRGPSDTPARSSEGRPSPEASRAAEGQVRIEHGKLDALLACGADLLVAGGRSALRAQEMETLAERAQKCASRWREASRRLRVTLQRAGVAAAEAEALEADEEIGRLARDAARLADTARDDARGISRTVAEVLGHARTLRMRPFSDACEALPRALRDLAVAAGKEVTLEITGGGVEADRTVLDGLRDPLLQLVRNAVDHGIEAPEDRSAAGKPASGTVRVAAELRGDRLVVALSDDGRGLDAAKIRTLLEERGIQAPTDERGVAEALFTAGLSTLAEATTVSGRGVGLDIVQTAMARLGGWVDVTWDEGQGTTFVLDCPVTVASLGVVLVSVGSQVLAIPLAHVERLHRAAPGDLRLAEGRRVLPTPEGPVPVVSLARLLPPLAERAPASGEPVPLALLRAGPRRLAVAVEDFLDAREVAIRPIKVRQPQASAVRGAALLETGRVALVVDPVALVAAGLQGEAGPGIQVAEPVDSSAPRRRILVVDDSITTRTLERSILEAAGYEVITAVDGSDGWRVLQEQGCDLVVADIEMPRMDGFALCEAIRASRRFARVPIVLVTALEHDEDRARGLEVGADAYIGKSSFDQQNLLDTIRQLLD